MAEEIKNCATVAGGGEGQINRTGPSLRHTYGCKIIGLLYFRSAGTRRTRDGRETTDADDDVLSCRQGPPHRARFRVHWNRAVVVPRRSVPWPAARDAHAGKLGNDDGTAAARPTSPRPVRRDVPARGRISSPNGPEPMVSIIGSASARHTRRGLYKAARGLPLTKRHGRTSVVQDRVFLYPIKIFSKKKKIPNFFMGFVKNCPSSV